MKMTRAQFLKFGLASAAGTLLGRMRGAAAAAGPVQKRPIPSSGELIPIVGTGTAVIYENELSGEQMQMLVETLRSFLANGGSVMDTSPSYGRAEKNLGEILRRTGLRDRAFLATKISTTGQQAGIESAARSFRDLGTERIDLLQVHNIRDTAVHLRTIRSLKDQGKVRYAGITTSFDRTYGEYEHIMRAEKLDFVQIDYALDNRNAEERILPAARELGLAVLVNLPFGRGRLFAKTRDRPLPQWAAEIDCATWAQFFLKFVLGHPSVTAVIPGTDRPEYALDNLEAARGRMPDEAMRRNMVSYWEALA